MKKLLWSTLIFQYYLSVEDEKQRSRLYSKVLTLRQQFRKPTLNIGGNDPRYMGDVNLNCNSLLPGGVCAPVYDIPYADKHFSVAYGFHILEHLKYPGKALQEWDRVAEVVLIDSAHPLFIPNWVRPGHQWVFVGGDKIPINPTLNAIIGGSLLMLLA